MCKKQTDSKHLKCLEKRKKNEGSGKVHKKVPTHQSLRLQDLKVTESSSERTR